MAAEKFSISSRVVYTLKSDGNPDQDFEGLEALQAHAADLLGAYIDRLHLDHTGNYLADKIRDHEYITKHADDLQTILALSDAVTGIKKRLAKKSYQEDQE